MAEIVRFARFGRGSKEAIRSFEGFERLAEDRSFSPKMRDKFRAVFENRLFDALRLQRP
jgi:hypothetical protein